MSLVPTNFRVSADLVHLFKQLVRGGEQEQWRLNPIQVFDALVESRTMVDPYGRKRIELIVYWSRHWREYSFPFNMTHWLSQAGFV